MLVGMSYSVPGVFTANKLNAKLASSYRGRYTWTDSSKSSDFYSHSTLCESVHYLRVTYVEVECHNIKNSTNTLTY